MDNSEYNSLRKALKEWDKKYDLKVKMIKTAFSSRGYHTTLKGGDVHPIRDSLGYALALLDSELPENEKKALEIIEKVASLQDKDPTHATFGIWSWFYEEPLDKMAPPDWNWADFCGKFLLLAAIRHEKRFTDTLASEVKQTVFNACEAIIKRNVGPGYTNIAIMGSFVTILAGEYYGNQAFLEYGINRLERFYNYTTQLGAFEEYNSPDYTTLAVLELNGIHSETKNSKVKELSSQLLDFAWRSIGMHFHPSTGQWAGPHRRSYNTLLNAQTLSFLQLALKGAVKFIDEDKFIYNIEWYKKGIQCPEKYISLFLNPAKEEIEDTFFRDEKSGLERTATTYLTPEYALGTINKEVMWNQCRNLVAYFDNNGEPCYLHLRFLHDNYDYSSAAFTCSQNKGNALFAFNFCTDGGDTHCNLDRIKGSIQASDLRVSFEFGGCLEKVEYSLVNNEGFNIKIGDVTVASKLLFATFGDEKLKWDIQRKDEKLCLDYVIYNGERKTIDFTKITQAAMLFALAVSDSTALPEAVAEVANDKVIAKYKVTEEELQVGINLKPDKYEKLLIENLSAKRDNI